MEEEMKIIKRYMFYCIKCSFYYSGPDEEPCSCAFCGTVNDCCDIYEDKIEE